MRSLIPVAILIFVSVSPLFVSLASLRHNELFQYKHVFFVDVESGSLIIPDHTCTVIGAAYNCSVMEIVEIF
jgi:hypothetical protein